MVINKPIGVLVHPTAKSTEQTLIDAILAHDAKIALQAPSATEFTIGHNVSSKKEVDAVMEQAKKAGAIITDPAQDRFWGGYAGYFQDPDGHLWEVAWNPEMKIEE